MALRILAPLERFGAMETASSVALLVAAAVALLWANSPWQSSYHHLWETPLSFRLGGWVLDKPLHFWVNDLLMTLFFLVVGAEIKHELAAGELASWRRAS